MESALNVYYMIMAVYGWHQWKFGGQQHSGVPIRTLDKRQHLLIIAAVIIISILSGALLSQHTNAAWPYIDSFTTWGSVITTIMVAKKVLENWLYWLVIDSVSIPLYIDRGLYLTAMLFMAYILIVIIGYLNWRHRYSAQQASLNA
jgi:nicotinamide mononucleotide transporter